MQKLDIPYEEISVDFNSKLRAKMASMAGKTSVPQIWFGKDHVGGCDDLYLLHERKNLLEVSKFPLPSL